MHQIGFILIQKLVQVNLVDYSCHKNFNSSNLPFLTMYMWIKWNKQSNHHTIFSQYYPGATTLIIDINVIKQIKQWWLLNFILFLSLTFIKQNLCQIFLVLGTKSVFPFWFFTLTSSHSTLSIQFIPLFSNNSCQMIL